MWVKSQDGQKLIDVNQLEIGWRQHKDKNDKVYIIWGQIRIELAVYSTMEKAKEALKLFEEHIYEKSLTTPRKLFHFPSDEEVTV